MREPEPPWESREYLAHAHPEFALGAADSPRLPLRYVQGKLLEPGADADGPGVETRKLAGRHDLVLQIGPPRPGWAAADEPLPERTLEAGASHELQVVLAMPSLHDQPGAVTVTLPAGGYSTVARFALELAPDPHGHVGRAVILHRGRVLQTLRVGIGLLWFMPVFLSPETAPRGDFDDLEDRGEFGVAFVVNHNEDGVPGTTVIPRDGVPVFLPEGWAHAANDLQKTLQVLVDRELEGDAGFAQAVYDLALHGDTLRREVDRDKRFGGHDLPPIQVVAARPDAWLPLELVYDGPIPEDDTVAPKLCERSLERLRADLPGVCDGPHDDNAICLLGFWGLRTVIERQAFDPQNAVGNWDLQLREPTPGRARLSLPTTAVFAAHRKADVVSQTASAGVIETLEHLGLTNPRVFKWSDWCARVKTKHPEMLVALAHTDWFRPSIPMLAIEHDQLKLNSIGVKHVTDGTVNPVVLLLGCSTANLPVPFQGIAAAFRSAGAPVVVSTIADVYGRYAGPAACAAIEQFGNAAGEDIDVGTVMLRLRRTLMGRGLPIGLGLLAYGDAEWRLGLPTTPEEET